MSRIAAGKHAQPVKCVDIIGVLIRHGHIRNCPVSHLIFRDNTAFIIQCFVVFVIRRKNMRELTACNFDVVIAVLPGKAILLCVFHIGLIPWS